MAYSDFTIPQLRRRFGLTVTQSSDLFGDVPDCELPPLLATLLARNLPIAVNARTEKARSELVISPMLVELVLAHPERLSIFSGIDFNVDQDAGLTGRCDFLIARDPDQLALTAPACVLVEAEHEDIVAGIPHCLAEMVAAQRFNAADGRPPEPVYGVVTTGIQWRFLQLDGTAVTVGRAEVPIQSPRRIFGILSRLALGATGPEASRFDAVNRRP